jgi:triacylglycerol lipase
MKMIHPVLLVHGIDDTCVRFYKMRTILQAHGFDFIEGLNLIPHNGSIPFSIMGEQVRDGVRMLLQKTGAPKVDIVAHSMGALAVRYYLQRLEGHSLVRRFISLAGPHHGTLTAHFRQNVGCQQMRPASPFLQDLNLNNAQWGNVQVYSFWTPLDLMILPPTSSILNGAHNRAFNVLLHPWMATDLKVIEAVAQTLAAG